MQLEQVKAKIQELITDFRVNYSKYEHGSEADTETKLIEPLFYALGWTKDDFDKRPPARREGKRGIADYSFKINDRIVFFLEAKKVGIPLEKEADKQVISYALSKRPTVPFAISTNFKELKIFCVEQENALQQTFRTFPKPEEYLTDFQSLLWLSRDNFLSGATLKKAEEEGRLKKRVAIDKILLEDLMQSRKQLVEDIGKNYSKYDLNETEEIIQRIIDRLIFIRRCEDVGINPENISLKEITQLPHNEAYPKLKTYFKKYNEIYNSGLFAVGIDNDCDKIKIDGLIIKKLIDCLYESKDKQYFYNFDWIDADVLGQVYEQYLGKILQQTKSGKAKLKDGQAHRKEQGIYYTPTYIVDFIVKNTLGELLKDKKTKVKDLKILDPACGSGSFLIKAFDYLYADLGNTEESKQHKLDGQGSYSVKTEILKKNLYGVDLDNKAVEITKLNLLLKAAEKNRKLPEEVDLHIKHGNSLIDEDGAIGQFPFKWENDFKKESFDVIIGNPPYVRQEELLPIKKYLEKYEVYNSTADLFIYFFEKELKLLKENGYFGMIVSNKWLKSGYGQKLRKFLNNYFIDQFIDFGDLKVFQDATTYPCIITIKKTNKKNPKIKICLIKTLDFKSMTDYINKNSFTFDQKNLQDEGWNLKNTETSEVFEKISKVSIPLKEYIKPAKEYFGIKTGFTEAFVIDEATREKLIKEDKKSAELIKPFLMGSEVRKYFVNFKNKYIILTKIGVDIKRYPAIFKWLSQYQSQLEKRWDKGNYWYELRSCDYYDLFEKPKIIYGAMTINPRFTIDNSGYFANNANFFIPSGDKKLLAILNSKLGWFLIANTCTEIQGGYQLIWKYFGNVPIAKEQSEKLPVLVDKMLSLNKQLCEIGDKNTVETKDLKDKIEQLDKDINKEVYSLYNLTEKEISVIENS